MIIDNPVIRYLLEDFTGPASRIEYGKAGDAVEVVKIEGNMALVRGKELFHIRVEKLSEGKPVVEKKEPEIVKSEPVKRKGRKPTVKQKNLF